MKNKRIWFLGLILTTIVSFLASSFLYVAPDEMMILSYDKRQHAVIAETGVYFVDPWADRTQVNIGYEKPTTQDYVDAMIKADSYEDAAMIEYGPKNPATETEVRRQVEMTIKYLDARPEAPKPITNLKVEFFYPSPHAESRYDTELAHYDYQDGVVRYNMNSVKEYAREQRRSLLQITVHELAHASLGPWTGETLAQLLTLQVLYDMMEEGIPGSTVAFYDELGSWFWAAASFRVEFNHGYYALNLRQVWNTEQYLNTKGVGRYTLEEKDDMATPRTWDTYSKKDIKVPYVAGYIKSFLLGTPYHARQGPPYFQKLTENVVTALYDIRANGLTLDPSKIVHSLGIAKYMYKWNLPWQFWHNEWVLIPGDRQYFEAGEKIVKASDRLAYMHKAARDEKLRNDPGYFARVWWAYLYGPLQLVENHQFGGRPVGFYALEKDIRYMSNLDWFFLNIMGSGIVSKTMRFEDIGPIVRQYLNPVPKPIVCQCDAGLWSVRYLWVEKLESKVKAFPLVPFLYLVGWFLVAQYQKRVDGWKKLRKKAKKRIKNVKTKVANRLANVHCVCSDFIANVRGRTRRK